MGAANSTNNSKNDPNQQMEETLTNLESNKNVDYSTLSSEEMKETFNKITLLSNQILDSFSDNFLGEEFCNKVSLIYQKKMEKLNIKVLREIKEKLENDDNTLNLKLMLQHIPKNNNDKYFVDFFHERLNEYFYKKGIKYQKRLLESENVSLSNMNNSIESELNYIDFNHVNQLLKQTNEQSGGQNGLPTNFASNLNAKLQQVHQNTSNRSNKPNNNGNNNVNNLNNNINNNENNLDILRQVETTINKGMNQSLNQSKTNQRPNQSQTNLRPNQRQNRQANQRPNQRQINQSNQRPNQRPNQRQINQIQNSQANLKQQQNNQTNKTPNQKETNQQPVLNNQKSRQNQPKSYPPKYEQHKRNQKYEQKQNQSKYEQKQNQSKYEQKQNQPKYEQKQNQPKYEQKQNHHKHEQKQNQPNQKQRLKYSVPRSYKEPEDLCEDSNNRGKKCLMTKKSLCKAIGQNFVVRNNIIAAILTAIPRVVKKNGVTEYVGGICFQKFLNLEKAVICVPLNFKELTKSENLSNVILALLDKSRYIDEKSCAQNNGYFLRLDKEEKETLLTRSAASEENFKINPSWRANKQYMEFITKLKNKYFESLNFLITILEELKNNPFISNSTLNQVSIKTKNVIDDMYNWTNYYYIYATLSLMKSDYLVQATPGLNQLNKINNFFF